MSSLAHFTTSPYTEKSPTACMAVAAARMSAADAVSAYPSVAPGFHMGKKGTVSPQNAVAIVTIVADEAVKAIARAATEMDAAVAAAIAAADEASVASHSSMGTPHHAIYMSVATAAARARDTVIRASRALGAAALTSTTSAYACRNITA